MEFPKLPNYSPKILVFLFIPLIMVAVACIFSWISTIITLGSLLFLLYSAPMIKSMKSEDDGDSEPTEKPARKRLPCPDCGSLTRHRKNCPRRKKP